MTHAGRITDVGGLKVGHATDPDARTGCTVVLGPFRAACDVRGMATGTRELQAISHLHLVERADAILLTGGSAYGLAAADGVMSWLEEDGGFGFDTGVARVPIVPAAVIFDLAVGDARRRPDAAMGRAACENASVDVPEGPVGAGAGATVGKVLGPGHAMPGGIGTAAVRSGRPGDPGAGYTVGALAVVNALGDVTDGQGRIVAGARSGDGFADSVRVLREGLTSDGRPGDGLAGEGEPRSPMAGANTTLCVVATDAPLDRAGLQGLARAGSAGLARRIAPAHTPFDGDITFAVSTAPYAGASSSDDPSAAVSPEARLALGSMAAEAVAAAVLRAVGSVA